MNISGSIEGDCDISCGVGEIELTLRGDPDDYTYAADVGIGELMVDGQSFSGISNQVINRENSEYSFNIDCGIGRVVVDISKI